MKPYLPTALLLTGLLGCRKEDAAPSPTVVGTWKYVSETRVATPLSGGASVTTTATYPVGGTLLTFEPAGLGTAYYSYSGFPSPKITYAHQGPTLRLDDSPTVQYQVLALSQRELVLYHTEVDQVASYAVTHQLTRLL